MCGVRNWPPLAGYTTCSVTASVVNYLKYKYFKYIFEIHTKYFVFEINYKSILYFIFNTLPKVSFTTVVMAIGMWGYTPVRITSVLV